MSDNTRVYGKLSVLRYHDPDGLARHCEMMKREFDYHLEVMPTDAVRNVLRSQKYFQSLYDPACFHFHPLNYARALAKAIEALNGRIFERSQVTGCDFASAEKIVRTARGEVRARDVIWRAVAIRTISCPACAAASCRLPLTCF